MHARRDSPPRQPPAVINIYRIFLIALCNVTCLRASRVVVSLLAYSLFPGAATYLLFPFFTDVTVLTAIAFMRGLSHDYRAAYLRYRGSFNK